MASSESTFMIEIEPSALAKHPLWPSRPNYTAGMAWLHKGFQLSLTILILLTFKGTSRPAPGGVEGVRVTEI